jgi:hypothetical protein
MMKIQLKAFVGAAAMAAILFASNQVASAATIIKLSLGAASPDLEYVGGVFSTTDDGIGGPASPGDQNTSVDFLDFLSDIPDIVTNIASYSLNGVTADGPAISFAGQITQPFLSGSFQIYDAAGALLLDVDLGSSVFNTGVAGGTGSVFTISNGLIVDGSLQSRIVDDSISFSIGMTSIVPNSPPLFTPTSVVDPVTFGILNDFTADGSKLIAGEVPEPTAALLMVLAGIVGMPLMRRRA